MSPLPNIQPLGKSQRAKNTKLIASVAVFNVDGLMLFGKRSDNKRWCCPGGHFEPNEYPTQAALRELFEETGLVPVKDIEFIGDAKVPKVGVHVYSFKVIVNKEPDSSQDPDAEIVDFRWVDPKNIPSEVLDNLHNKQDVTLQCLGLQPKVLKSEAKYWRANGIKIPHSSSGKRLIWDEAYLAKCQEVFGAGEVVDIDISKVRGYNVPASKERVGLYKKMLGAGEVLPPVVVRYDSDGFNLIDGNHRQEACQQIGKTLVKALVVGYKLEKGLGLSLLLGGALMGGGMAHNAPQNQVHSISEGTGLKTWTPEGLDKDLYPIAQLESSFGQNMEHAQNPQGEFFSAFGALGLKPQSAHDELKHNPGLTKEYPGLEDPADFHKKFKADPVMYNKIANAYFKRLKVRHGSAEEAARSWRYGTTAVYKKHPDAMADKEGYVEKYKKLAQPEAAKKPTGVK